MDHSHEKEEVMEQRARRGRAQWERILDEQAKSGLSAKAFCAREAIALSSFYNQRRRLYPQSPLAVESDGDTPFIDMGRIAGNGLASQDEPRLTVTLALGSGVTLTLRRA